MKRREYANEPKDVAMVKKLYNESAAKAGIKSKVLTEDVNKVFDDMINNPTKYGYDPNGGNFNPNKYR